ncbi:MAG: alpha/beta fold hydrolase [Thainema sp.]
MVRPPTAVDLSSSQPIRTLRLRLSQGQLFWREVGNGNGSTLLFLHGSWQDGEQWQPFLEQLGQNFHCLAPDLLGFGDSERSQHHYSVALEVECLNEYLDALRVEQVDIVAHSLGGWIGAQLALKYPDRVRSLALIVPEGVTSKALAKRWWKFKLLSGRISWFAGLLRLIQPIARGLGQRKSVQKSLAWRRQLKTSQTACQILFRRRRSEIQSELLNEALPHLQKPVLVCYGEDDAQIEAELSQTYGRLLPQAKLTVLSDSLTSPDSERLQPLINQLQAWLQAR